MLDYLFSTIDLLDKITIIFSFVTMIIVIRQWLLNNKMITILFSIKNRDKKPYKLPMSILRKHFTRSELQGVLSLFQKKEVQRYNISFLSTTDFFDKLMKVQKGESDDLIIEMTSEELEQFDINLLESKNND